jgi:ATP-dependent DNA helicase RecG
VTTAEQFADILVAPEGLDREENKALLLRHLKDHGETGCPMAELQQVLPALSRAQLKRLLDELRDDDKARLEGERRWARWYPANLAGDSANGS